MDEKNAKIDRKKAIHESMFQYMRGFNPGFYRWVKKELKKTSWVQLHIKELGYLILLDILHPDLASMKNASRTKKMYNGNGKKPITSRHRRRFLREYYPEIFFTPPNNLKNKSYDKRESFFKSIFTEIPTMDKDLKEAVDELLYLDDLTMHNKIPNLEDIWEIHSGLRMVEPEDILAIREFWKNIKFSLEAILNEFGSPPEEGKWLVDIIRERRMGLETFYRLVENAVALRWFRKKAEKKREKLLHKSFPLRYTKEDAANAVSENLEWFKDPVQVFDLINRGASAYLIIGFPKVSVNLYNECLKQIELEKKDIGLCYHNIANCYRHMNKPKKALSEIKKAMKIWEELKSQFDIGITLAYFAEYYFLLGKQNLSDKSFKKSLYIITKSGLSSEEQARAILYIADCAARAQNEDWERKALELGMDTAKPMKDASLFLYYSQRLNDLTMGKNTVLAEQEPGKLKHPPEFLWYRPTPTTFVPIHPQRKTGNLKEN